ncbi:hypothetical protein AGLY_004113 [Aphis glycines]|uniref:Uncharacterized protein n=1 Tax=Aphis glycines TaxID=307491 RepID=A0A6G0TXJ4_APHGL|nr:hypothetical protein AGLY_004113 [Aphis glycines]
MYKCTKCLKKIILTVRRCINFCLTFGYFNVFYTIGVIIYIVYFVEITYYIISKKAPSRNLKILFYRNLAGYYIYYLQHLNINKISKENKIDNRTIKKKKTEVSRSVIFVTKLHESSNLHGIIKLATTRRTKFTYVTFFWCLRSIITPLTVTKLIPISVDDFYNDAPSNTLLFKSIVSTFKNIIRHIFSAFHRIPTRICLNPPTWYL